MEQQLTRPDYIFEISWEVCNKVGGIHTVITTKTLTLVNEWEDKLIMIGPDVWKGTGDHPEFEEDNELFKSWRLHAAARGLKIKIGRWKITGNPIVILVDFTPLFTKKDDIFSDLWEKYKLDSLTGQWDYTEPALFGYAAGMVIECFYHHYLTYSDKIVAQFHEWMTGAGILYLEDHVPQIGTVFTTHATVVGRAIAGKGLPLYSKFDSYNGDQEARGFNVSAKHSLEKISAAFSDCFTTVSKITAKECEHFLEKKPDMITPNGFESFIVPDPYFFKEKRALARKRLLEVARAVTGEDLPEDSMLIIKSGRYEFRNKGIDLFIDSLKELKKKTELQKDIVAFIFIPANHTGPRREVLDRLEKQESEEAANGEVLTHYLQGAESDPILERIKQNLLVNRPEDKVKIIFAPVYLSGDDGVFNMSYYDLLIGFDLSVFPSYYEPWGYTPLESLAFHIPTLTTNLTGFGMIVSSGNSNINQGILVIDRNDNNDGEVVNKIATTILEYAFKSAGEKNSAREAASQLSKTALWKNYINNYLKAYSIALDKTTTRTHRFKHEATVDQLDSCAEDTMQQTILPQWRKIFIQSQLPERLKGLEKLSMNLWWTWNIEAIELFASIDAELWKQERHNPITLLSSRSTEQINKLLNDKVFLDKLDSVLDKFEKYINAKPSETTPHIGYFCMEYGLDVNLKLYSGGLGILAGDYLKEASDAGINLTAVGLLYRHGYFKQVLTIHGEQLSEQDTQKFTNLPLLPVKNEDGSWKKVSIAFPGRTLYAKVWKVEVGRIKLYLLDTDIHENRNEDKQITAQLYGGDWENRLKQELLLGIGGVRLLQMLGPEPDVFHYNEGHAAFAGLERLRFVIQEKNISFNEALEIVRASTLFTTHTPVPAGHDRFSEEQLRAYLSHHAQLFNIPWKKLMALGKLDEDDKEEDFSMSNLAARLSLGMNGVSAKHEKVSRGLFHALWQGYNEEELQIGHVTNGVHYATWTAPQWQKLFKETFGEGFTENLSDPVNWKKITGIPDKTIWKTHTELKKELIEYIKESSLNKQGKYSEDPIHHMRIQQISKLNENALIFGFGRRIVTYKRPELLFYDLERLTSIIRNSGCEIIFLFSGKAHPHDAASHEAIRHIIEISKKPEFEGKIFFLDNYDIDVASMLVRGVDVWLNTPEPGMEASGTSGMKAMLNGVLNCSMEDGWWAEGYRADSGWLLPDDANYASTHELKNELHAEILYHILEDELIPLYLERDSEGIPVKWIAKIKNALANLAPVFTTGRMLKEYNDKYYQQLRRRSLLLNENNFEKAKYLAAWKNKVLQQWKNIKITSTDVYDSVNKSFPLGGELISTIVVDLGQLTSADIGIEILFTVKPDGNEKPIEILFSEELKHVEAENNQTTYQCRLPMNRSGVYEYGFRIFPKNPLLFDRMDFPLVRWI